MRIYVPEYEHTKSKSPTGKPLATGENQMVIIVLVFHERNSNMVWSSTHKKRYKANAFNVHLAHTVGTLYNFTQNTS